MVVSAYSGDHISRGGLNYTTSRVRRASTECGTPCETRSVGTATTPPVWRNRATKKQGREGWEMALRITIIVMVLDEAHERQVQEVMHPRCEGPEEVQR